MTETFQTFSGRPGRYYIFQAVSILTIALPVTGYLTNWNIPKNYVPLMGILFAGALIATIIYMILTVSGRMYLVDGALSLSAQLIIFKSIEIPLSNIKRIGIKADDYKGARASDGSGNKIEICLNDKTTYTSSFVIASKAQKESLNQIIEEWKLLGVGIEKLAFS